MLARLFNSVFLFVPTFFATNFLPNVPKYPITLYSNNLCKLSKTCKFPTTWGKFDKRIPNLPPGMPQIFPGWGVEVPNDKWIRTTPVGVGHLTAATLM